MLADRTSRSGSRGPKRERGFALLLVFALAASVAILVYLEIPRVAFERQRDKEALLIDRGEQYARAIELYARKTRTYPQSLDQLEQGQTVRYLRRRYKDPMSGKDEWRLIHMGPNGMYVDSKVHKVAGELGSEDVGPSVLASRIQGIGQSASILPQDGQGVPAGLQKRASDRIIPGSNPGGGSGDPGQNGSDPNAPNQAPNNLGQADATRFPFPAGQTDLQQQGNTQSGATPTLGSVLPSAQQDATNNQAASAPPQAMQAIQSILGGQRAAPASGGSSGQPGAAGAQGMGGGSGMGAGLAGVATTVEMEGIRRYKDHSNYSEWEFLYDPKSANGQGMGTGNTQNGGVGNGNGGAPGVPFGGMPGGGSPAPAGPIPKN